MPKRESMVLLIILGNYDMRRLKEVCCIEGADSIIRIKAFDLTPTGNSLRGCYREEPRTNLVRMISELNYFKQIQTIKVVSERGSAHKLEQILDSVEFKLCESCQLILDGFHITNLMWNRIVARFDTVFCHACRFGVGWWKGTNSKGISREIGIERCTGSIQKLPRKLCAWPNLKSIRVYGGDDGNTLTLQPSPYTRRSRSTIEQLTFAEEFVTVHWNAQVEELVLDRLREVAWIANLPISRKLDCLFIFRCRVTDEVFAWVISNKNLRCLALSWPEEVRLAWNRLDSLRRLRCLFVEDTFLDDEQLEQILRSSRLCSISAYNTALTSASWSNILSNQTLSQFWGSGELCTPNIDFELPSSTKLKEFIVMNANPEPFKKILSLYPNLKIVEM